MPHARHARHYVSFTIPFDDYAHPHAVVLNTIADEEYIRTEWRKMFNKDMKIVKIQELPLDVDEALPIVNALNKEIRDAAGDAYRIPLGGEENLTQKQVDNIRRRRAALEAGEEVEPEATAAPGTFAAGQ
jgi:hypothetical protein